MKCLNFRSKIQLDDPLQHLRLRRALRGLRVQGRAAGRDEGVRRAAPRQSRRQRLHLWPQE